MPIAVTAAAWVELAHVDAEVQTAPTFDLSAMWQQFPVLSEPCDVNWAHPASLKHTSSSVCLIGYGSTHSPGGDGGGGEGGGDGGGEGGGDVARQPRARDANFEHEGPSVNCEER